MRLTYTPLPFSGGDVGERIRNLRRKKAPLWLTIIAAAMCIMLAGCLLTDRNGGEEHSVDFPQGMYDPSSLAGNLFTGEDGKALYYISRMKDGADEILYFLDTESGIALPMCGKPECKHNTSSCNAMIGDRGLLGIQIYDGQIWYHMGQDICRMDLDGTNRETVASIDRRLLYYGSGASGTTFFHRGWAIHAQQLNDVKGGNVTEGVEVYALPLDDPGAEPEVILQEWYPGKVVWEGFIPAGDWMYIFLKFQEDDPDTPPVSRPSDMTIMRWSLTDRTLETVWTGTLDGFTLDETTPWVNEDCILFHGYTSDWVESVYRLDLASGELEKLFDTDGIPRVLGDIVAVKKYGDSVDGAFPDITMTVTDLEGNTLLETLIDTPEPPEAMAGDTSSYIFSVIGSAGDMLYMQYYYFSTTGVLVKNVYTVRMDLTTGETDALGGWYERNY